MNPYEQRFSGIGRLYGQRAWQSIRRAKFAIIGVGGVGSWTAEALVRTGIEHITLVDLDEVCISNTNRQLHAHEGNIGRAKVEAVAERMRAINPDAHIDGVVDFFTAQTSSHLLDRQFDVVIDAIDSMENKCLLISLCVERRIPLITCGGAGGRTDPSLIRIADLGESTNDSLLRSVRKKLRKYHHFPATGKLGVPAVYSLEAPVFPNAQGEVCSTREAGVNFKLDCATGYGTASFVSGSIGFAAASAGIRLFLEAQQEHPIYVDSHP